ncbi:MAG: ScpA family protein [Caulobacteraceae bacterium]
MNRHVQADIDFQAAAGAAMDGSALIVDLDGFEGPLDVLLSLARSQKVDLLKLSVARLAEQYLAFIREARRARFGLAADYLVMAAWLAYLKSRLLLPRPERALDDEPSAEDAAACLTARLARLDAVRSAAATLGRRAVLGREVFSRGDPDAIRIVSHSRLDGDLHGLLEAFVGQRRRARHRNYRPAPPRSYRLDEARERLSELLPEIRAWTPLSEVAPAARADGPSRASLLASTLSAGLELVREGRLDARQTAAFSEIWLRARVAAA